MLSPPKPPAIFLTGDVAQILPQLPDNSIDCIVTSPPYFGLRDYGTASWQGGSEQCDHRPPDEAGQTTKPSVGQREHAGRFTSTTCWKCGALRIDSQIGLEQTPSLYVEKLTAVFRQLRRVLKPEGTCWLNLGDSYAHSLRQSGSAHAGAKQNTNAGSVREGFKNRPAGLKEKDLIGIPWRVAFALQADGWYLRQDIIWHKPNPMPESVRDRCTKAHEYLFLLTKSEKYYFDAAAIAEPAIYAPGKTAEVERAKGYYKGKFSEPVAGRNDQSFKAIRETRNRRSVWTISTKPYKEAHFATFPPDLVEPCILAGSPLNGVVLDPFSGAGTTSLVAQRLGRRSIGIELNPEYVALARKRLEQP